MIKPCGYGMQDGTCLATLHDHTGGVESAFSPTHGRLLSKWWRSKPFGCGMSDSCQKVPCAIVWSVQFSLVQLTLACHPVQVRFGQWSQDETIKRGIQQQVSVQNAESRSPLARAWTLGTQINIAQQATLKD